MVLDEIGSSFATQREFVSYGRTRKRREENLLKLNVENIGDPRHQSLSAEGRILQAKRLSNYAMPSLYKAMLAPL